jgi:hypothetical protein
MDLLMVLVYLSNTVHIPEVVGSDLSPEACFHN